MYPKVEHVQVLNTCGNKSIFDSAYGRHVERSVHTAATCRIRHVAAARTSYNLTFLWTYSDYCVVI